MIIPIPLSLWKCFTLPHFLFMPRVKLFDENEVLIKAMNLFWKQGYAATSINDLVSHLGINRASLYSTFGDKDKLFKKALQYYRKTGIAGVKQFFENYENVKEGFSKLFEIAIDEAICDADKKGCFVVNTTTELVPGDPTILKALEENKKELETIFFNALQKGKDKGQLKSKQDLKIVASLLYTLYSGVRVVSKINPDKKELTNSMNLALSLLN
ncbi:TetR/AcrR family transcriptional regulator [Tenacibaculum soleae]|uniref:TetR/AcrR family transcriptional regulator n=1 Tax=Tenacibaculum soleae TaxID=447689 RepID=UPI0023008889|nr:TetR/AcrR family transcriptional regulator [Tenacibaculum soleae]